MLATKIQEIALRNGFQLKLQPDLTMALHTYVFDFANDLITEATPKRDRQIDRERFTDPDFNEWLDGTIAENGMTVWDLLTDTDSAQVAWASAMSLCAQRKT